MRTRRVVMSAGWLLGLSVVSASGAAIAWTPLAVNLDPLVRMPGNQENDGIVVESSANCMGCHSGYDSTMEPGFNWQGSMMSNAMRDPIFWATLTVAAQDSLWAVGRPNATDICLRCHSPTGWLGGRSDPTNGSAMAGADFDGVSCDFCHSSYDPFFEDTAAGVREGSDWLGYWDETNLSATPSNAAAATTLAVDRTAGAATKLFNGTAMYSANRPRFSTWTAAGGGQYFVSTAKNRRASFADANPAHKILYSRFHKSKHFCGTCHDVSNPALANLANKSAVPGDGTTVLTTEQQPASAWFHVERTNSEFMLSGYGQQDGTEGVGPFAPGVFKTSRPGNKIATCQDCHMSDMVGTAANKAAAVLRPTGSTEHPKSGLPRHDFQGGNAVMPRLIASAIAGSPNYNAGNAALLNQGANLLTLNMTAGLPPDPLALIAASDRSLVELQEASALHVVSFQPATGALMFRLQNHTGHKLPTGYPEGRRMFVNVRALKAGALVLELNPYDLTAGTLKGLGGSSPPLGAGEAYSDQLVYESHPRSSLTGEDHTFHFALADSRYKDNRIPPKGFRINEAAARLSEPAWGGSVSPGYFTAQEYANGYDEVALSLPAGTDSVQIRVYYQTTSREYVEFLRDEINGTATTLKSPAPSGEPKAYVAQTDPFFAKLKAWGPTIWSLWDANRAMPGFAPILMTETTVTSTVNPCQLAGSDGAACDDGTACTTGETCLAGTCGGGVAKSCLPSDQCHVAGVCDPGTGLCSNPTVADGTGCNDGSACTKSDTCQGGSCLGASPVTCAALDPCHLAGACNPATGVCDDPIAPDGTACAGGTCSGGICLGPDAAPPDAADDVIVGPDAEVEAGEDVVVGPDAEPEAGEDVVVGPDAELDAEADANEPDATGQDAMEDVIGQDAAKDAAADAKLDAKSDAPAEDGAPADAAPDSLEDAATADAKDAAAVKDAKDDGAAGAAGSAVEPAEVEGGGCGCRTAGNPSRAHAALLSLLALIGLASRRRR